MLANKHLSLPGGNQTFCGPPIIVPNKKEHQNQHIIVRSGLEWSKVIGGTVL